MLLNLILVVIGLVICFGGIYLRRVCAAFTGLIWGALSAFIIALMTVGIWRIGDDSTLIAIIVSGLVFAILSAIYYKACAVINGFLSSGSIVLLLLLASDNVNSRELAIFIAVVVGIIVAVISVKFYDYSFIITTALTGGFIASVGGYGLFHNEELSDTLVRMLLYGGDEQQTFIIIGTLLLGIIGFVVQLHRLTKNNSEETANQQETKSSQSS